MKSIRPSSLTHGYTSPPAVSSLTSDNSLDESLKRNNLDPEIAHSVRRLLASRGALGPKGFVVVEQPNLRQAGLEAVRVLPMMTSATAPAIRLQLTNPDRASVYEFLPSQVIGRLNDGSYKSNLLRLVLDCFLLALLYDVCVRNVSFIPTPRRPLREPPVHVGLPHHNHWTPARDQLPVRYLPDRDHAPSPRATDGAHGSPGLHEVNWFVRRLPVGWQTSEQAIQHAREYGVELAPGDTFVLPHQRRAGHTEYFCYDPEIRSTHAVAEFERAFASS